MRPKDYGDQYPSDSGDTPPVDPTEGFSEYDYTIESPEDKEIETDLPSDIAPDPGVEQQYEPPVRTYFAVILKLIDPREPEYLLNASEIQYWCLRQDGKRVAAYVPLIDTYERYDIGDDVLIRMDSEHPWDGDGVQHWIIISKAEPLELPVMDVTLSSDTRCLKSAFIIPFDTIHEKTAEDEVFGDPFELILRGPGRVVVGKSHEALYHIEFSVALQNCDPSGKEVVDLEIKCGSFAYGALKARTTTLMFNRQNGFRLFQDPDDECKYGVMLKSSCENSILNQQKTGGPAHWTDSPKLAGSISVATKGVGYVKIGTDKGYVWLTHGGGQLKFKFPPGAPPATPAFLVAVAATGECVQTDWMHVGGTGKIKAKGCEHSGYTYCYIDSQYCAIPEYPCQEWVVCNGLVVSGPGIKDNYGGSPCSTKATGAASCPSDYECKDDPCEYL